MRPRRQKPGARGGPSTTQRVGDEIRMKISELLRRELRDPRLAGVHLTRVEMTRDLSLARVFWRPTPGGATADAAAAALAAAGGFLRGRLGRALHLRAAPELRFALDELPDEASGIDTLLAALASKRSGRSESGRDETDEAAGRAAGAGDDDEE